MNPKNHKICIIGLGYVGLPLAIEFSKKYKTIGYDINLDRIKELKKGFDSTGEVSSADLKNSTISYSSQISDIKDFNTYIITVPTPIDDSKHPNLSALKSASKVVGEIIKKGDIVIFESTVYPGCTNEECIPIIEKESKLTLNDDFLCGYSPERINPGDKDRTLKNITKIVSGSNQKALDLVDQLYASIISEANTFPVKSIKIAEAAKAIENAQRDLNIAFVNELSLIFEKMNIDTNDVIEAAATKWNFMPFKPGLVGGHCIGVDPYYLTYKSNLLGYSPEVILAGRNLNDNMGKYISQRVIKSMISNSIIVEESRILILGFTFKENCPDTRNTKVIDIVKEFEDYKIKVDIYDCYADKQEVLNEYGISMINQVYNIKYDAIVLAVAHNEFLDLDIRKLTHSESVIFDVKSFLPSVNRRTILRL